MRFLCISDIHGHADALSAVLAAAERRGYSKLLVAGDLCFPGPQPLETWRRLLANHALCVLGVGDQALASIDPDNLRATTDHERWRLERLRATQRELGELILVRLAKLPRTLRIPIETGGELLVVHGSPHDPSEAICHDMSDEEIQGLLGDEVADIVICGSSHVPFDRQIGSTRVINVGSVGEAPGGGHAHATFLETRASEVLVEQFVVPIGRAA